MKKTKTVKLCVLVGILAALCLLTFALFACEGSEGKGCDHLWVDATCTTPKTCFRCGISEGEPLYHNWVNATCTKPKTCSLCGETEGSALSHSITKYTVIDPTCTQSGSKKGECDRCHNVFTVDTYVPLGHRVIHGNCARCGADQNNIYVAIQKDDSYGISNYITQAFDYYNAALKVVLKNERYFDYYYTDMLQELNKMWDYSIFAQNRWSTEKYAYPATAYEEMRAGYTALKQSEQYQTYMKYKDKDYDTLAALVARNDVAKSTYDYLERIGTKNEELLQYFIDTMLTNEYLSTLASIPDDIVCYGGVNATESGFRISCNSDLRIIVDSFNKDATIRAYVATITDGEHVYAETVTASTGGTHNFTFKNCVLNEGAKVTLSFFNGNEAPIAQFELLAVADEDQQATGDDDEATKNPNAPGYATEEDPESLDNALVGFTSLIQG